MTSTSIMAEPTPLTEESTGSLQDPGYVLVKEGNRNRGKSGVFAHFRPANHAAIELHAAIKFRIEVKADSTPFHLEFLGHHYVNHSSKNEEIWNAVDQIWRDESVSSLRLDYYELDFNNQPSNLADQWQVGFSTADEPYPHDIPLLLGIQRAESKQKEPIILCSFQFNLLSGALVLVSKYDDTSVEILTGGMWQIINKDGKRVLYGSQSNRIRLLERYEYELVFPKPEADRIGLIAARNNYLSNVTSLARYTPEIFPPAHFLSLESNTIYGFPIGLRDGIWMHRGVDVRTGDPVDIREYLALSMDDQRKIVKKVTRDVSISLESFGITAGYTSGLVSIRDFINMGGPSSSPHRRFSVVTPAILGTFNQLDLRRCNHYTKVCLFFKTLKGLKHLHGYGYAHRLLSRKAMAVLSFRPPEAALTSFQKTVRYTMEGFRRNNAGSIELRNWAIAIAQALLNAEYHPTRYGSELLRHETSHKEDGDVVDLLVRVIEPQLQENAPITSAEEALRHPAWLSCK